MPEGTKKPISDQTILVVEDETLVRMDICDTLRRNGYNVLEASSADDALGMLDRGTGIQLVFTDIRMPGRFDGLDLARYADERGLPVILTSGHLYSHEVSADIGPIMPKPYRHADILNEIRRKLIRRAD